MKLECESGVIGAWHYNRWHNDFPQHRAPVTERLMGKALKWLQVPIKWLSFINKGRCWSLHPTVNRDGLRMVMSHPVNIQVLCCPCDLPIQPFLPLLPFTYLTVPLS